MEDLSKVIYSGEVDNRCIICGSVIPEGRGVCWSCEKGIMGVEKK